jgi:hypothetical protein
MIVGKFEVSFKSSWQSKQISFPLFMLVVPYSDAGAYTCPTRGRGRRVTLSARDATRKQARNIDRAERFSRFSQTERYASSYLVRAVDKSPLLSRCCSGFMFDKSMFLNSCEAMLQQGDERKAEGVKI